jgi:hypothetical protein
MPVLHLSRTTGRLEFDFVSEQRVGKDDFILNDVRYACMCVHAASMCTKALVVLCDFALSIAQSGAQSYAQYQFCIVIILLHGTGASFMLLASAVVLV